MRMAKNEGQMTISGKGQLLFKNEIAIDFNLDNLTKWLFHSDRAIQQEALQAILNNSKRSELPT